MNGIFGSFFSLSIIFLQTLKKPSVSSYKGKELLEVLRLIPTRDKKRIEYFFQQSLGGDAFGYVLFGDKPMAFGGYEKRIPAFKSLSYFLHAISPRRLKYKIGFETWRKYENLFPITRFIILYEEIPHGVLMILINKKNFIRKVQEHADDFITILQREVTGEKLLDEGKYRPLISEVLANHDGLLGTLLGYGRENAHLFHQGMQVPEEEQADYLDKLQLGYPWEKEYEELRKNRKESANRISSHITGSDLKDIEFIHLPGFRAILDHPETIALKEHYLQTREKIITYYKGKDFLEATLRVLTSESTETINP